MANTWILIRHPDKEGDKEGVYLGDTAKITSAGQRQMDSVIPRLKLLSPTIITCSMLPRAVTLAKHIAKELGLGDPIQTGLLNEIDKPRFLIGRKREGRLHKTVMRAIRKEWNANTVPTRLLRGEKIRKRSEVERDLKRLIKMVEEFRPTHHAPVPDVLLSVTHAKLIAAIGQMLWNKDGSLRDYYDEADSKLKVSTTGITILTREPNRRTRKMQWHVKTWNEETHADSALEEFQDLINKVS